MKESALTSLAFETEVGTTWKHFMQTNRCKINSMKEFKILLMYGNRGAFGKNTITDPGPIVGAKLNSQVSFPQWLQRIVN